MEKEVITLERENCVIRITGLIFRRKKDNGEWKRLSRQPQHL